MHRILKITGILILIQLILSEALVAAKELTAPDARCFKGIKKLAGEKNCGRDFWFMLREFQLDKKFTSEPLFKESGSFGGWGGANKETIERATKNDKPVILNMQYTDNEKKMLKSPEVQKILGNMGQRFIGLTHLEGTWNVVKSSSANKWPALLNLKFPQTKEASYQLVRNYFEKNLLIEEIHVCPGSIGFLDHHTLSWGASATTSYWGSNLIFAQLQAAFSRGAARQFKRPWNVYYATCGVCCKSSISEGILKNATIDSSLRFSLRSPEIVYVQNEKLLTYKGAHCGADIKTTVRPNYYYAYMSGVNFLENESDSENLRYAAYDPNGEVESPLIRLLRDNKIFLSPMTLLQKEVYDYTKKQPRGIPYTPFAVLLDQHHGYTSPNRSTYFTFATLEEGDHQINALFNVFFPFNDSIHNFKLAEAAKDIKDIPAEQSCFINLPYGNLFDVLTNEASDEILQAYPVIIMAGNHDNPDLKEKLLKYVANGGTLVLATTQIPKDIPPEFHNIRISEEILKGKGFIDDAGITVAEKDFSFYKTELLDGAACIYKESNTGAPLIISNAYGKGKVLICTIPHFLNVERSMPKFFDTLLKHMIVEIMPVQIKMLSGQIDFSLNKVDDYYLATLINYDGLRHSIGRPVEINKSKTAKLILSTNGENMNMIETITGSAVLSESAQGKTIATIEIEPGDVKIVKITKDSKAKGE